LLLNSLIGVRRGGKIESRETEDQRSSTAQAKRLSGLVRNLNEEPGHVRSLLRVT